MTFLELVNSFIELSDTSNTPLATAQSQSGSNLRAVNWVRQAWVDIQNLHDNWAFMRQDLSFVSASSQSYTLAAMGAPNLRRYDTDSLRMYLTASGVANELYLVYMPWEAFRNVYLYGARQLGRPNTWSFDPTTKSLNFASNPGTGFTTTGYYWRNAASLSLDADVPACPSDYHMAIVYRALLKYAGFEGAPEVKQEASENYSGLMSAMEISQLPEITMGGALT